VRETAKTHIGQYLRVMNRQDFFDGLQFHNKCAFHQEIDSESAIDVDRLVLNGDSDLTFERQSRRMQFVTKTFFISALQKARTQGAMHFDRRADNFFG